MTAQPALPETDPRRHTARIRTMLNDVINHAREDVEKVSDPKAQALFENHRRGAQGLVQAYDHFEQKSEAARR